MPTVIYDIDPGAANPSADISKPAATVSPSPGGEGRGESEQKTNSFPPLFISEQPTPRKKYVFCQTNPLLFNVYGLFEK
jgi:hypothetical protein